LSRPAGCGVAGGSGSERCDGHYQYGCLLVKALSDGGSVDDPCDEATRHKRVSGRSVRAHVISPALVVFNDAEGAKQHGFVKDSLANGAMPR
jgi:hypothetical protein